MPLYNNILLSRKNDATSKGGEPQRGTNPNASMKLLQDHLLSKRRLQQQNSSPVNSNSKVQKLQSERSHTNNNDSTNQQSSQQIISESTLHKPLENDWEPEEEYDPMIPNSYEVLQTEYLKAEEQRLAIRKSLSSNKKIIPNLLDVLDKLNDDDNGDGDSNKTRGTSIAPPPALLTSSSSSIGDGDVESGDSTKNTSTPSSDKPLDGGSVAAKIMSRMGYKLGQGLGRDEQGISSPLEVEKQGLNAGRILPVVQKPSAAATAQKSCPDSIVGGTAPNGRELVVMETNTTKPADNSMAELLRESTRVLLLQNMVGPGEVDDDLEAETKEECKKYGDVVKCLIYEIPNKRVADNEAVRIFVEFRKVESAIKAVSDLNGRYFGGRVVRASFYSVERFNKYNLGPEL